MAGGKRRVRTAGPYDESSGGCASLIRAAPAEIRHPPELQSARRNPAQVSSVAWHAVNLTLGYPHPASANGVDQGSSAHESLPRRPVIVADRRGGAALCYGAATQHLEVANLPCCRLRRHFNFELARRWKAQT
jgi:hypothetical protein